MKICVYYSTLRCLLVSSVNRILTHGKLEYRTNHRFYMAFLWSGLSHCDFSLVFLIVIFFWSFCIFFLCESFKTVVQLSSPKASNNGHYHPNWIIIRKNERISYGIGLSFFLSVLGRFILEFSLSAVSQPHKPLAMSDTSNVYM